MKAALRWTPNRVGCPGETLGDLGGTIEVTRRRLVLWFANVPTLNGLGAPEKVSGEAKTRRAARAAVVAALEARGIRFATKIGGAA